MGIGVVRLLEIFRDFKIYIRGSSNRGYYTALYEVVRREDARVVTVEDLREYIRKLQERYPDRNFMLKKVKVKGKEYYVITRKSYYIDSEGRKRIVYDRVPIYFDLENQKFYVPKSYLKIKPKLVKYIVMRVLGALGVARVKYVKLVS